MSVLKSRIQGPTKSEKVMVEDSKVKVEGAYDQGYGAPDDKTPPPAKSDAGYQVPGVTNKDAKDSIPGGDKDNAYDMKDTEKDKEMSHSEPDCDDEDCKYCAGSGKVKKVKDAEVKKEEAEESKKEAKEEPEDTKKMDYGDKYVQPSDKEPEEYKGVPIHAEGLNFGKAQLFKPTKEELVAAKSVAFNKNAAFGIKGKSGKSATAVAFDKWAAAELERYTLNKQ